MTMPSTCTATTRTGRPCTTTIVDDDGRCHNHRIPPPRTPPPTGPAVWARVSWAPSSLTAFGQYFATEAEARAGAGPHDAVIEISRYMRDDDAGIDEPDDDEPPPAPRLRRTGSEGHTHKP